MRKKQMIPAGKFKAECLRIMDQIDKTKQTIIITKRRVPIVEVVPILTERTSLFGSMKGSILIKGDIIKPIGEEWDADT